MSNSIDMTHTPICPISGIEMKPWLHIPRDWRRPKFEGSYQLYWCQDSQMGRLYPIPDSKTVASFYNVDEYYTHSLDSRHSNSQSEPSFLDKLRIHIAWRLDRGVEMTPSWFSKHFGSSPLAICEIGCGNGRLLEKLRKIGHSVFGVEPDPKSRNLAVESGLQVFAGTGECLPFEISSSTYNIVIMSHVLEHTLDPVSALRNVAKILAPGGKLIVETPNNLAMGLQYSQASWFHLDAPRHLNFFTSHSLRAICEKVGFKPTLIEFRGYCRQFTQEYIETEQRILKSLYDSSSIAHEEEIVSAGNSRLKAWLLLLRTALAFEDKKYDSVRIVAEHP